MNGQYLVRLYLIVIEEQHSSIRKCGLLQSEQPERPLSVIEKIWAQGTGGEYRLDITGDGAIADLNGKFIQNSDGDTTKDSIPYSVDILVIGAATLTVYVTNNASTSTVCKAMIQYRRFNNAESGSDS